MVLVTESLVVVPNRMTATSWLSYPNDCDFSFYRGAFGYRQEFGANATTLSRVLSSLLQQTRSKLALDANDHMRNLYLGIRRFRRFFGLQITWWEAINWPAVVYEWRLNGRPYKTGWQGEAASNSINLCEMSHRGVMIMVWCLRIYVGLKFWSTWQARDSDIWILVESDSAK